MDETVDYDYESHSFLDLTPEYLEALRWLKPLRGTANAAPQKIHVIEDIHARSLPRNNMKDKMYQQLLIMVKSQKMVQHNWIVFLLNHTPWTPWKTVLKTLPTFKGEKLTMSKKLHLLKKMNVPIPTDVHAATILSQIQSEEALLVLVKDFRENRKPSDCFAETIVDLFKSVQRVRNGDILYGSFAKEYEWYDINRSQFDRFLDIVWYNSPSCFRSIPTITRATTANKTSNRHFHQLLLLDEHTNNFSDHDVCFSGKDSLSYESVIEARHLFMPTYVHHAALLSAHSNKFEKITFPPRETQKEDREEEERTSQENEKSAIKYFCKHVDWTGHRDGTHHVALALFHEYYRQAKIEDREKVIQSMTNYFDPHDTWQGTLTDNAVFILQQHGEIFNSLENRKRKI